MFSKVFYILEKKFLKSIILLFFLLLLSTFFELISIGSIPIFLMTIIDPEASLNKLPFLTNIEFFKLDESSDLIYLIGIALIFVFFIKNSFLTFLAYFQGKLRQRVRETIKKKIIGMYLFLPYKYHLEINPASLARNITHDSVLTSDATFIMVNIIKELFVLLGIFLLLFFTTPPITVGLVLILSFVSYFFYFLIKNRVKKSGKEFREAAGYELKNLFQTFGSIKETKILSRENYFFSLLKKNLKKIENAKFLVGFISAMPRLFLEVVTVIGIIIVPLSYIGMGYEVQEILPYLALFVACALRMIPAFNTITSQLTSFKVLNASVTSIYDELKKYSLLKNKEKISLTTNLKKNIDKIIINDLNFSYEKDIPVLKNISLSISIGEKIGILGKSGSGKSTFVDLLLGLHLPDSGKIIVNEFNIQDDLRLWQSKIGYLPQSLYLFDDTILNNITYGLSKDDIDFEMFNECLKISNITNFVNNLKDKENTTIGNNGVRISGGEKQRIGIARALYNKPELLIFDESTSSLDSENEKIIMNEIDNLDYDCTKIIISHKLNPLLNCNKIYVFDNGKIIKSGTLEEIRKDYLI